MTKLLLRVLYLSFLSVLLAHTAKANNVPDLKKWGYAWEEYDSSLFYRLQSVDDLLSYTDSVIGTDARQSRAYVESLANTIRKRFFHGYSYYSATNNWLSWLAGVILWDHLHAIVLPDDIMKFPNAACSQQAIVLKECFKAAGIDYREVDLTGHFVLEGRVEGQWLLFDTNLEPRFPRGRKSLNDLIHTGELRSAYQHTLSAESFKKMFAHPVYRQPNAPIAIMGTVFQLVTRYLSLILPFVLPFMLVVFPVVKIMSHKRSTKDEVRFVEVERRVEKLRS